MLERTLLIIKPDAVERNLMDEITRRVESKGYRIVAVDRLRLTREEAELLYEIHRGKPFFEKLVEFMTSGLCMPVIVEGEGVVEGLRELVGATDPANAAPGTIRKDFALDGRRNSVHASDSPESAEKEIEFFFGSRKP